jgi:hypothetical protein
LGVPGPPTYLEAAEMVEDETDLDGEEAVLEEECS